LALPPLDLQLARDLIERTRVSRLLRAYRDVPAVKQDAVAMALVKLAQMAAEIPEIRELDINPLLADEAGVLAVDARVVVGRSSRKFSGLGTTNCAVRPYPSRWERHIEVKDGWRVFVRPIRPEDEPIMIDFHTKLSERTVYLRYFQPLKLSQRTAHERLTRICFNDYDREMALVVERKKSDGGSEIIAVGRLSKQHGRNEAELAALVRDEFQGKGLGTELYRRLLEVAQDERIAKVVSTMLGENREMRRVCEKLGFGIKEELEDNMVKAEKNL